MMVQYRRIVLGLALTASAVGQSVDEYRVKAAFLYNFAKFVEWPPQAFKSPSEPISICIVGKNSFGGALDLAVSGQAVQGRPFVVRQTTDTQGCQILFVSSSERKRLPEILRDLKAAGVLTVGESENFTSAGGVVNFCIEEGKIRLQINVDAAAQQQLRISSKLLSLAEIVKNP